MNREEWNTTTDWLSMLRSVEDCAGGQRLFRLVACACGRKAWQQLSDTRSRNAVIVGERYADGEATEDELLQAYYESDDVGTGLEIVAHWAAAPDSYGGAWEALAVLEEYRLATQQELCNILRDMFDILFEDSKLTAMRRSYSRECKRIASEIYNLYSFSSIRKVVEAISPHSSNRSIVQHCSVDREHFRGCWAIDVILGKR